MPSGRGFIRGGSGFSSTHYVFYSGSDDDGRDEKMSKRNCCTAVLCFVFIALITAGLMIGVGVGVGANFHRTDLFSPGDSRLLSLPSFFCQGGTLELLSNTVNAELFRVNTAPPLNESNNFTVTLDSSIEPGQYRFFQFHLYPNSNFTVFARVNLDVDVYIVKGDANAERWERKPSASVAVRFYTVQVSLSLDVTYQVTEEDDYYIYFYNSFRSSQVSVSTSLYFERFEYSTPLDSEESCTISLRGQCTVGIPYSIGVQRFLVLTSIPEDVNYSENIELVLYCNQRGWVYALVILLPLLVSILMIAWGAVVCYRCHKRQKSSESHPETAAVMSEELNETI